MFSVIFTVHDVVVVVVVLLLCFLIYAAVQHRDPDRREAAQRVLAMIWRRPNIPTVQGNPPLPQEQKDENRHTGTETG